MTTPAIAKRAYHTVALFALVNMLGLGVVVAYLSAAGVVDGEKLGRIGMVLRGEPLTEADPVEGGPTEEEPSSSETAPAENALADSRMNLEIMRREADRIKEELRQQLALANSIMIRVTAEREAYQRRRIQDDEAEQAADSQRNTEGFKKTIELLRGLKPKQALEHLLAVPDPDEVAYILLSMDTRSAKRIIGAAKTPEETARMKEALQRMRSLEPDRSEELGTSKG